MQELEILQSIKELSFLGNSGFATSEQVAKYYNVNRDTINWNFNNFKNKFILDGVKVLNGKNTKEFLTKEGLDIVNNKGFFTVCEQQLSNNKNILFPVLSILRISMLLRDSDIAIQVRNKLLKLNPIIYSKFKKENNVGFKKYETEIGNYLKFSFGEENVKEQELCGLYRLDFILYNNIHIEIDEHGHSGYDEKKEKEREEYIKKNTSYITIRYNPFKQMPFELIKDILAINDRIS